MKLFLKLVLIFGYLNLSAQTWQASKGLPDGVDGRNHAVSFSLNGKGYLGLGYNRLDSTATYEDFYRFDPASQSWQAMAPFPGGTRGFSYAVATKDKAYVGFGKEYYFDSITNRVANRDYKDLWEYDPKTDAWKELASCPCLERFHPAFIALDSQIFVGLGGSSQGNLSDWWEYNINQDKWIERDNLPGVKRHHPYYFGIDSIAFVGFGHGNGIFKDFYAFNANTSSWKKLNDFPGEARVAGSQFSHNGKGYIISGQGNTHRNFPTGQFWRYEPLQDTWAQLTPHPGSSRWAPANIVIGDTVYFGTGQTTIEHSDFWKYGLPASPMVSVTDIKKEMVLVYPNPSNGNFNIMPSVKHYEVYTTKGALIVKSDNLGQLDLARQPKGVYLIRLWVNGEITNQRVVLE